MTWLGLLLIGLGATDLLYSCLHDAVAPRHRGRIAEAGGALVVVSVGLLAGLDGGALLGIALVALATLAWGEAVTYGFGAHRFTVPLLVLAVLIVAAVLASTAGVGSGGVLGRWLDASHLPLIAGLDPGRALLLAGALLVQLSTGNVLVRLVLGASGTSNPLRDSVGGATSATLKGGRLLGPMERVFILGLGLAGELTAAGIVIAAKGLLRFPELQATRRDATDPGIHEVTEYFLVGSFVSWSVSLVCLALVGSWP